MVFTPEEKITSSNVFFKKVREFPISYFEFA